MDVEILTDNMPTRDLWISGDDSLGMGQEILFRAGGPTKGSHPSPK
jgi:hypothetical protein